MAVVAGAAAASLGPLVRSHVRDRARRIGASAEVGSVSLGWAGFVLGDVAIRLDGVEGVAVRLERVEVQLDGAEVRALRGSGGRVDLRGDPAVISAQLEGWRGRASSAPPAGGGSTPSRLELSGDELSVHWEEPSGAHLHAIGVRYALRAGTAEVAAAQVKGSRGPVDYEMSGGQVTLVEHDGGRRIQSGHAAGLSASWRAEPSRRPAAAPSSPPSSDPPPAEVRRLARRVSELVGLALAPSGAVEVESVRVDLALGEGDRLALGPGRLRIARESDRATVRLVRPDEADPGSFGVEADLPFGPGPIRLRVRGGPLRLGALGVREGDLKLVGVDRARVTVDLTAVLAEDDGAIALRGRAAVADLGLSSPALAPRPVLGMRLEAAGDAHFTTDGASLTLAGVELTVGTVRATLDAAITRQGERLTLRARGGIPLAACQGLLDSLPAELTPTVSGSRLDGTFSLAGSVLFDTATPDALEQRWSVTNECRYVQPSGPAAPGRFRAPFRRTVPGSDGRPLAIETGPGTADWVPYGAVSPHVTTALLVCEDGRFFRHRGFDQEAIENSLRENLRARRFVRGASTLTMQLAKNLYLSRDKTLARKIEEAFLTVLLEQSFTKEQLLELYLNVVEFGPGIYGIGPAARHWFATTPSALSLPQALYLASILPNPKVQHFGADGRVAAGWLGYLRRLMRAAERLRRVTPAELEIALREHPAFRVASSPTEPPAIDEATPDAAGDAPHPLTDPAPGEDAR